MKPVYVSPEAESDLADIWSYIAGWDEDAADAVIARIRSINDQLSKYPYLGRSRDELTTDLRSMSVKPYIVYYRVCDDAIEIVRVLHGARDQAAAIVI